VAKSSAGAFPLPLISGESNCAVERVRRREVDRDCSSLVSFGRVLDLVCRVSLDEDSLGSSSI